MSRGGRRWFTVESKAFELVIDEVGGKLRGCIWERCKGISSWIRFGDASLSSLLVGVESCCRDRDDRNWSFAWRRREGKAERGWVAPFGGLKDPLSLEMLKKEKELDQRTYADVAKLRLGRLGDKMGKGGEPSPELDYLKNWAVHTWLLKGKLDIAVMGGGLMLFEFELVSEAECVLARGKRKVLGSVLLMERWHPEVGCFSNGAFASELIGDGCGGFIAVDNKTDSMAELQWARMLVKTMGRDTPSSVQIVDEMGCFSVQLWWESPPWFSQVAPAGSGLGKGLQWLSSKGVTGFPSELAERGPGAEVIDGEDSLGIRSQGVGKSEREACLKPDYEGAQMVGPDCEPRPITLKGWLMSCEDRPFLIKGSIVGCEGRADMGFEPELGGIKGNRASPHAEVGEMEIKATMEASGGQDKEDGGIACFLGGD
ncbi:hypothetical protein CK203_090731 [Vitis vinifera]|uniref:DUF4283 domain-containing protein n=1 Tax=Vitis vinifera TaxID=29760 RepID=A0A438CJX5_VITVI|nr:hypothetical protein CK203_090731 [Vitis vinifera]